MRIKLLMMMVLMLMGVSGCHDQDEYTGDCTQCPEFTNYNPCTDMPAPETIPEPCTFVLVGIGVACVRKMRKSRIL